MPFVILIIASVLGTLAYRKSKASGVDTSAPVDATTTKKTDMTLTGVPVSQSTQNTVTEQDKKATAKTAAKAAQKAAIDKAKADLQAAIAGWKPKK